MTPLDLALGGDTSSSAFPESASMLRRACRQTPKRCLSSRGLVMLRRADPRLRRAFELSLPFMTEPCRRMWRTLGPPPRSEEHSEVPPAHLMVRSEPSADHDLLSSFPSCRSQARDPSCGPFGTLAASVRPLGSEEPFGRSTCLPLSLVEPWVSRPALASLRKAWRGSFG
jgi:hypothetical protein